jgi:hypothetical protein
VRPQLPRGPSRSEFFGDSHRLAQIMLTCTGVAAQAGARCAFERK